MKSKIYAGKIMHRRLERTQHAFVYPHYFFSFAFLVDFLVLFLTLFFYCLKINKVVSMMMVNMIKAKESIREDAKFQLKK